METKNIDKLYQRIADAINNMIPDKWNKIYLYAEVLYDSRCVYFDFESASKKKFVYSLNIPEEYNIDERKFKQFKRDLISLFEELHEEFKINTPQVWTNLAMYLENSGEFRIDYNYDEVKLAPHEQRIIWKYKYLGVCPTDEQDKRLVDEYKKNNEKCD